MTNTTTIHAQSTPDEDMVLVTMTDNTDPANRQRMTVQVPAVKALALAAELIQAANRVLEK